MSFLSGPTVRIDPVLSLDWDRGQPVEYGWYKTYIKVLESYTLFETSPEKADLL